ncbi:hypothetical protein DL546_006782 [Coniochaeta pulveracea]|uniref:Zn(2)-C6 fungal-type domain-containing protein n=1 Tax=Coniochaeta pulveracea TaxID=177199 RepID=A0A420YDX4_9PEZI|nr:hypothetical protein DL546_006782 [Coniochaeta pulveracea]
MSTERACVACRSAKAKCDHTRPTCGRCAQRGLICSGLPVEANFTFRDENEVAKRNSQRARREQPRYGNIPTSGVTSTLSGIYGPSPHQPSQRAAGDVTVPPQQDYWWLSRRALAVVPGPLKRDVETRAVERFFLNWILHPSNQGISPGYMSELPMLYHGAQQYSVLWLAVRAMAFADMRNERAENVPFQVKARQHYGAALTAMRAAIDGQKDLGDDGMLTAMLLIDHFELMYLARNDPLSAHSEAIRHVLQTRGEGQLYTPTRFSLWRLTHYRLQAWQTLSRERPDAQQIEWLHKLNMERPDLRICAHVLHMNILSASSKTLTQPSNDDPAERLTKLNQAKQLASEMQDLITSVENWASEMAQVWKVKEDDPRNIAQPQDVDESPQFPIPHFPYPRLITYDDIWLV